MKTLLFITALTLSATISPAILPEKISAPKPPSMNVNIGGKGKSKGVFKKWK